MTLNNMLRELGYTTSPSGITSFQHHYNRLGSTPVLVTGELDEPTKAAVRFAFGARHAFMALRDRESDDA